VAKDRIDITITATRRPGVLLKTLESFYENLFMDWPTRIIINVDPVGESVSSESVAQVCKCFTDDVLVNLPEQGHFGKAFNWVWSQVTADLVFNLEDDWQLLKRLSLGHMVDLLSLEPKLAILRLPMSRSWAHYKNWNKWLFWTGSYFQCPDDLKGEIGFCGHPSLIRSQFTKEALTFINPALNPEKEIKGVDHNRLMWLQKWDYGVFSRPNESEAIRDIGREWRHHNGFLKCGFEPTFTEWKCQTINSNERSS